MEDFAELRAKRAARRDPLHAPDEPLLLFARPFDAPAGAAAAAAQLRRRVRRELCTVADAKAALFEAAGVPPSSARLILHGRALQPDDALLWDLGARPRRLIYWQQLPAAA